MTVWMKLVAAVAAEPPVARVAPNLWPPSVTWKTRMSMLVHQSTLRPGSPSRMYGSGDLSSRSTPALTTV